MTSAPAEYLGQVNRSILGAIVDENAGVDKIRDLADGGFEGLRRVIGGQNDRDAFAVDHGKPGLE